MKCWKDINLMICSQQLTDIKMMGMNCNFCDVCYSGNMWNNGTIPFIYFVYVCNSYPYLMYVIHN